MLANVRILSRWILALTLAAAAGGLAIWLGASGPDAGVPTGVDVVQATLRKGKPTVVEFGANACAACRDMKPVLAALAKQHRDRIEVLDVDVLRQRDYLAAYRIQALPTQVFFDANGRETGRNLGPISASAILERLHISSLDVR
jgi:thioredoxin 1